MARYLTISEARQQFLQLPDQASAGQEPLIVTRHGRPALVILGYAQYEELRNVVETAQMLANEVFMAGRPNSAVQTDVTDSSLREARKRLGL